MYESFARISVRPEPWMNSMTASSPSVAVPCTAGRSTRISVISWGLLYIFSGTGSLDHVELSGMDGRTVLLEDFTVKY